MTTKIVAPVYKTCGGFSELMLELDKQMAGKPNNSQTRREVNSRIDAWIHSLVEQGDLSLRLEQDTRDFFKNRIIMNS